MFYLVAYGFATIAAFGIVAMVRQSGVGGHHLSQWAGLGRRHPVVAGAFAFLLLAFAGIPLTSGFTAKFAVFAAAVGRGGTASCSSSSVLCSADHGLRLRPGHRADVLQRAGRRRRGGRRPIGVTTFAIAIGVLVTSPSASCRRRCSTSLTGPSQFVR